MKREQTMGTWKAVFGTAAVTIAAIGWSAAGQAAQGLPQDYLGVWMNMEGRSASCSDADWDGPNHTDTHMRVLSDRVEFHEGGCEITSVSASEFGDARVMMQCGAEGEAFKAVEIWALRTIRDHQMLVTTSLTREAGATIVYQQCP